MKTACLLVASASAFAPSARQQPRSVARMAATDELGVLPPLGLWDPLGLCEDSAGFPRRRAVEIKHGRISMIAFVGMLVQELGITFPGYINTEKSIAFADIGTGFEGLTKIPGLGWVQILLFCGLAEIGAMPAAQYTGGPQNLPGGYDGSVGTIPGGYPFTSQIEDVTARNRALTCELQNGRAAMLG